MSSFEDVVRSRRMVRSFLPDPLPDRALEALVDLASRAPSAGKAQGWQLVVLEGPDTSTFWDITLPTERRAGFRWPRLLDAPAILLPFADPQAYLDRYAEPDKTHSGLGLDTDDWPAPYWTIDASMAVMTLLLGAHDMGLGALFFGVFRGELDLRTALGVPEDRELLGAIALGVPADDPDARGAGRSASRPRRTPEEIVHRGRWNG